MKRHSEQKRSEHKAQRVGITLMKLWQKQNEGTKTVSDQDMLRDVFT